MPCAASLEAFHQAITEFVVTDTALVIEPAALVAARESLDSAGLLLLGEVHGVRENPLLIRALMQVFGLTSLALEWPEDLAPSIQAFLAGGALADDGWLWSGDGRITAGHLAVLAERAAAGPLELILFDGLFGAGWSWSQRDEAMARRILAASASGGRTLALAGNALTQPSCTWPRRSGMRRRWKSGATYVAAALMMAAAAAGMTGCASSTAPSIASDAPSITSGAPPTVICGTVLSDSAAGAVVDDATRTLPTIMYETVGGVLFFRVAPGCDKGVSVRWTPSSAARLVKAAYARDGGIAAVVLEPNGSSEAFRLTGTRNGRVVASAIVKLAS